MLTLLQKNLKREEKDADGQLDFEEFVHYLQDYEKDLKLVVKSLDKKDAGERASLSSVFNLIVGLALKLNTFFVLLKVESIPKSSSSLFMTSVFTFPCSTQRKPSRGNVSYPVCPHFFARLIVRN